MVKLSQSWILVGDFQLSFSFVDLFLEFFFPDVDGVLTILVFGLGDHKV